jgi:hypothetical protein
MTQQLEHPFDREGEWRQATRAVGTPAHGPPAGPVTSHHARHAHPGRTAPAGRLQATSSLPAGHPPPAPRPAHRRTPRGEPPSLRGVWRWPAPNSPGQAAARGSSKRRRRTRYDDHDLGPAAGQPALRLGGRAAHQPVRDRPADAGVHLDAALDGVAGAAGPDRRPAHTARDGRHHGGERDQRDPVSSDERGFFIVSPLPESPVRLRCDTSTGRLVTDWVTLWPLARRRAARGRRKAAVTGPRGGRRASAGAE